MFASVPLSTTLFYCTNMEALITAFRRGYRAYKNGELLWANPYHGQPELSRQWQIGWHLAKEDDK